MAIKHPYISATGAISQVISQFRKNFPSNVDAPTLKKYDIAPNNESYLINMLKFIGIIDDGGQKTDIAKSTFVVHDDEKFSAEFAKLIESSYADLFALYGDDAWQLPRDKLISFFRQSDETSDVIGTRQASTFIVLAQNAKKRDGVASVGAKKPSSPSKSSVPKAADKKAKPSQQVKLDPGRGQASKNDGGIAALTVRIEVNLPAGADQSTYDAIFKSIKANLMQ